MTESYHANRETVVKLLNEALATELVCVLRYKRHYFMASGTASESASAEFLEHAGESRVSQPAIGAETRACRIRVVDDNQGGADLMVGSIDAAFDPEVVLRDIGLPGMNGYAVARKLRESHSGRRQCLIAMTGYGTDEDRQRTVEAGFDHHIVKPIEPAELNALLAKSVATMGL